MWYFSFDASSISGRPIIIPIGPKMPTKPKPIPIKTTDSGNPSIYEGPTSIRDAAQSKAEVIITALFSIVLVGIYSAPILEQMYSMG